MDSFALAPMQAGMLYQSLRSPPGEGIDIQQISMTLREALDLALFVYAWYRVIDRHPSLRTRLLWEGLDQPRQEVMDAVDLPVTQVDWRELDRTALHAHLMAQAAAERAQGFELDQAPLMRLFVARVGEAAWSVLWTFHHLLLDGRSFPVVLREVFAGYDSLRQRQAPELPPTAPFRAHVEALAALDLAASEAWWREALRGVQPASPLAVELAPALAAAARPEPVFGARQQRLDKATSRALEQRARHAGVTPHTLLQGAWALLLSRYGAGQDIVFGSTRSGRHGLTGDAADAVGMYIVTVPMRIRVDASQRIDDWLLDIRSLQVRMRAHEQAPLPQIQAWSGMERGRPLFESLLVYDHQSLAYRMRLPGEDWAHRHFDHVGQTAYPLCLVAYGDDALLLRLEYDRRRFSDAAIDRMLGHLRTVLGALAQDMTGRVGELPWLTPDERSALIGQPPLDFGPGQPLHLMFEQQVLRAPQAPALTSVDAAGLRIEWTYAELNTRANALAHRLRALGVRPGRLVGLRTQRQASLVVGMLAILKAGAAYLPLDPVYPQERVVFMLQDAAVGVVLTQRSLADSLELPGLTQLCIDEAWPQADAGNPEPVNGPDDLAYVIYTSGSTGQPKGVPISHRHVARLFEATRHWFGFDERDVWTLFHSYAFDFSVWELWGALLHGGRLVTVSLELGRDIEAFCQLLRDERVTVLNQTPTAFRRVVDRLHDDAALPLSLRYVIFGGEALELQMLRPWFQRYGDRRPQLVNMYGITETTVHVSYRPLGLADLDEGAGSVIGEPIPDLKILLLDARGDLVPVGVPGELVVAGAGLAPGYLNRPELTAQRFASPANLQPTVQRIYRSGDLARWLDDGDLEYLGRIDQQVKIRGFRIELGEIESRIAQHARVRQVAVVAREDVPGDKRLAAYVVPADGSEGLSADLRESLRAVLPDYMLPAHWVMVTQLPLTPNGKLDQRALPVPQETRIAAVDPSAVHSASHLPHAAQAAGPVGAPLTTVQQTLVDIWSAVLRVDGIGIDDHFFELGGDSILSIQIVARCRQAGLSLTLNDLFDHPTIAALASKLGDLPVRGVAAAGVSTATPARHERVDRSVGTEQAERPPSVAPVRAAQPTAARRPGADEPQTHLLPIQHWFFDQDFADNHHWNQAFLFEVPAAWPLAVIRQAWRGLLQRHGALTQRFARDTRGRWQIRQAPASDEPVLIGVDLQGTDDEQARSLTEERCAEAQAGLDLVRGPLARAVHFDLGPQRPARLLIVIHHLVVDGVSWRILREDLEEQIGATLAGRPWMPPEASDSMGRWVQALQGLATDAAVVAHLPYWRQVVAQSNWCYPAVQPSASTAATGTWGTGSPAGNGNGNGGPSTLVLSATDTRRLLQQVPARHGTQINAALLSALLRALPRLADEQAWRIDLEGHGREPIDPALDVSRTVGWFTSLFPVSLHLAPQATALEALLDVQRQLQALPARGLSFGVLRWLSPDIAVRESLARLEPAPLLFNYLGQFDAVLGADSAMSFAQESAGPWRSPRAHHTHAVELVAQVRDGCMELAWHQDPLAVSRASVELLKSHLSTTLQELLATLDEVSAPLPRVRPAAALEEATAPVSSDPAFVSDAADAADAAVESVEWDEVVEAPEGAGDVETFAALEAVDKVDADDASAGPGEGVETVDQLAAASAQDRRADPALSEPGPTIAPLTIAPRLPPADLLNLPALDGEPQVVVPAALQMPRRIPAPAPAPAPAPTPAPTPAPEPALPSSAAATRPLAPVLPALRILPPPARLAEQTRTPESEPYALTAMQRLFFAMDELRPELGLQAWQFLLEGALDSVLLRRALLAVIERHTVLRSGFSIDAQGQPCQRVFPMAALARLPWHEDDLRGLPTDVQEQRLQESRAAEARQRLTLDRPPLMRVRLLRTADERWHLLWTTHHLMLDGWSWPLLLAEWSRTYSALDAGRTPHEPPAVPFRRYVEAVARPSEDELAFWRSQMAGFTTPTALTARDPSGSPAPGETITHVAPELAAELLALARRLRTTPGTLFNAAWALALAHGAASRQVAFGIAVAGRPAELEGIERLIGPCVNNVPLCVELDASMPMADWVASLHARQRAIAQKQTTPLDVIQAQSAVPWRHRLFDSLVVFQNYLIDPDARGFGPRVSSRLLQAPESTNYGLTLTVTLGEAWRIRWLHGGSSLREADLQRLTQDLQSALAALVRGQAASLGEVLAAMPDHSRGVAYREPTVQSPPALPALPATGRSRTEAEITTLWCELFGVSQVSLDDNFFDLGGHSMLLLQAHRLLQQRLGIELPIVALLRQPTVRGLARLLEGAGDSEASSLAQNAMARARRLRDARLRAQGVGAGGRLHP